MEKYIIRENAPEYSEFDYYFDNEYIKGVGNWNTNLFIIGLDRYISDFNGEEWTKIQEQATNIIDGFAEIGGKYATYNNYKECMKDFEIPYTPKKCHDLKEWAKHADERKTEDIARFLSIITGERWNIKPVHGYCQGDYAEVVFCDKYYTKKEAKSYGEVWLGCAKEFCVITLDEAGDEVETVWGYIVADNEAWTDEEYKKAVCDMDGINPEDARLEMIDGQHTYTDYTYRVA